MSEIISNETIMKKAESMISIMSKDKIFVVKDLFVGAYWNNLSKGNRLGFGKYFKNQVICNKVEGVTYIGKRANNTAQYRKMI